MGGMLLRACGQTGQQDERCWAIYQLCHGMAAACLARVHRLLGLPRHHEPICVVPPKQHLGQPCLQVQTLAAPHATHLLAATVCRLALNPKHLHRSGHVPATPHHPWPLSYQRPHPMQQRSAKGAEHTGQAHRQVTGPGHPARAAQVWVLCVSR